MTSYRELDYEAGKAIQTLRKKICLTQTGLAERLGISVQAVREWERGGNYPKAEHFKALMALAVGSQAFSQESEEQEIRVLWKTTRQKWQLDEDWLYALLSESSSPQVQSHQLRPSLVVPPQEVAPVLENRSQDAEPSPPELERDRAIPVSSPPELEPKSAASVSSPIPPQQPRPADRRDQNRARMLRRLARSYSELMSQSLQGAAWFELGLTHKPDAVQNAANLLLRMKRGTGQHWPAGTSITEVYDQAEHELLILGEPGAGKSTLLLDLAQKLLLRAEQDETHPLPVILPLSTWAVKRLKLEDWMAEQVSEIYEVPQKLSAQWVREGALLPLLDGLDEMEEALRPACIAALNAYHHSHLQPLVVCSRKAEYEVAAEHRLLTMQSAVVVQPLTHAQVEQHLVQMGQPLATLHTTLQEHPALQELVTTPLMLNVLILTYRETGMDHLPDKQAPLQEQIWKDYVARMVERKGDAKRYPHARTVSYLHWLAQHMQTRNQTMFYLEHLQPDWLEARHLRTYSWWAVRLPGLLIGIVVSLVITLFMVISGPMTLLQFVLLGALLGTLYTSEQIPGLTSVPALVLDQKKRWQRFWKHLAISLFVGLLFACCCIFLEDDPPLTWFYDGLIWFICFAPDTFLLQYFLKKSLVSTYSPPLDRHTGRWKHFVHLFQAISIKRFLIVAMVIGPSYGLAYGLIFGLNYGYGLNYGLSYGLGTSLERGLLFGLSSMSIGLILDVQAGRIHLTERLRWTWGSLRRGLSLSHHFRVLWPLTSVIFLSIWLQYCAFITLTDEGLGEGVVYGLIAGLVTALGAGLGYWLLSGLFQGIAQEQIEDHNRRVPNQGIRRSLHNSMIMGIISGGIIGVVGLLSGISTFMLVHELYVALKGGITSNFLTYSLSIVLSDTVNHQHELNVLWMGVPGGLLVCIATGGLAVWRHYTIRFLLWRSQTFPGRVPQFLNDASARFLLRRVGGGYSFTHRLLLDYFADGAHCKDEGCSLPQENARPQP